MIDINRVSSNRGVATEQDIETTNTAKTGEQSRVQYETAKTLGDDKTVTGKQVSGLEPPGGKPDLDAAQQGMAIITKNAAVDFFEIAALMVKLSYEQEKASADEVVADILSVADEMNKSADDLRSSAGLALASGVVSGSAQIASGGLSMAGGIKSFNVMSESAAAPKTEPEIPEEPEMKSGADTAETLGETGLPQESAQTGLSEQATGGVGESMSETAAEMMSEEAAPQPETTETETTDPQAAQAGDAAEGISAQKKLQEQLQKAMGADPGQTRAFVLSQKAQSISMKFQGLSQTTTGAGQVAASGLKYGADHMQAQSKKDDAVAEQRRAALEREKQYRDSLNKAALDMQQTLKEVADLQHQTASQIWSHV